MANFNPDSLTYIIPMAIPLWISIYVFTRDPLNLKNRLTSFTIFLIFSYFLLGAIQTSLQTNTEAWVLTQKLFSWAIILPTTLWLHLGVTSFNEQEKSKRLVDLVKLSYAFAAIFIIFSSFTNLVFDYSGTKVVENTYWPVQIPAGVLYPFFFLFILSNLVLAAYLFFKLSRSLKLPDEKNRFKHLFFGSIAFVFAGIYLFANIQFNLYRTELPGALLLLAGMFFIVYGSIKYKGINNELPFLLNKEFLSSSAIVLVFLVLYITPFFIFRSTYSFNLLMVIVSVVILVPITHSAFDWLMSYSRNIFALKTFLPPLVTDEETSSALRNLNRPEKLEDSSLLRLKRINKQGNSFDNLRDLIYEAVEFFKPKESKRNRQSLKYEILKMISEQVEEGKILWDLGFEEYPLGMSERSDGQEPRFAVRSPTDYQAISRNAFISLKKEAIHDLAWRISYLEKQSK